MSGPGKSQVPSYMDSSSDRDPPAVGRSGRTFRGWDFGHSSSSSNLQNHEFGDEFIRESGQPYSSGSYVGAERRMEERLFEPSNQFDGRSLMFRNPTINLNAEENFESHDIGLGMGVGPGHNLYKFGRQETGHGSNTDTSSMDNVGTSSGNPGYFVENDPGSGSSLGNWGSSCKRKAFEGSSGHYQAGSSSYFQQGHNIPPHYGASSSLNISSSPANPPVINPEHLQYGNPIGPQITESSSRNFCSRLDMGNNHHVSSTDLDPRPNPLLASSSTNRPNQYHRSENIPDISRTTPAFPIWNGSSLMSAAGERGFEENFLDPSRNSRERPFFPHGTGLRIMDEDTNNSRNASIGNLSSSSGIPSGSRNYSNPLPSPWNSHHNSPPQGQRLSEMTPWSLFPHVDSDSGARRGQMPQLRPGPSVMQETGMGSGSNHGHRSSLHPRTSAWLMEAADDELNGWRSLSADIEGRQRLVSEIQQVLNAMRRIENLRAEDYMMLDPFINGVGEFQDRHRDMRLDVDNMSYEELLALEEQIGNVSTGLNEETIMKDMQQRKFMSLDSSLNSEPCCVCQEEYVIGDDIGTLECGHDFHRNCIKQWLTMKNVCPICKMTALGR
ncbi:E3 ubiquitin-protein ligase MBR1-like [Impatiens glandulifera]|uniref:E3 ubiquitin-protein ligase MBR1-like n=1 Tax=Impatiens glandulifera TaxID=253017 RepID=UPI001FB0B6EF|nr:E3 ubiquitin-protein ligase MBR1-like [Impatiens glandulifera]XP_047337791.1 E3 ubiquitin-protein ligase MBR1-like [Impatiens glandulifera]